MKQESEQASSPKQEIVSRIFITGNGNVIVSDLWKELGEALTGKGDFDVL
ncbi:MAG: hypothetical protein KDD51_07665 [Bdellovibrionales bacterium]|nr:hypothetical protein [Bdellovibrionales bacterium]